MSEPILEIQNLRKIFRWGYKSSVGAVNDVSLTINRNELVGLIGESGSGKSTVGECAIGLQKPDAGKIQFHGRCMQIVFQDSGSAFNPRMTLGDSVAEPLVIKRQGSRAAQRMKVLELLQLVGLPEILADKYPAECSGGQLQRAGIARALVLEPDLLIADEPISSLDVSVQAQMVNLFAQLHKEKGMACLFISHDLAMVRYLCSSTGVMRDGKLIEFGETEQVFSKSRQPYTKELVEAILYPDPRRYQK